MSQLLLYSNVDAEKNDSKSFLFDIEGGKSKLFNLNSHNLHFSWIDKNNYRPYYESTNVSFYCLGILYVEGERIDKKWKYLEGKWNSGGLSGFHDLDGYGNLLIYDRDTNTIYIITARMGFMPVYYGKDINGKHSAIGTHPDQIAEYLSDNKLDKLSIAEFISTTCITAPHTYYENIKQLEPASIYRLRGKEIEQIEEYWQPDLAHENFADREESARLIADYIKTSINKRISNNNSKGLLMLSGGLDSRAALFAPDNPSEMLEAVTFYTEPNTELKLATKLANKAGVKHHPLKREYEYYSKLAVDGIRLTGGMYNFLTLHTSGFDEELRDLNEGVLLSAMYFDTFFKGFAFEKKDAYKKLTGSMYKVYADQSSFWDTWGFLDLKKSWSEAVAKRRANYYEYEKIPEEKLTPQLLNKIKFSRIKNMSRIRGGGMDHDLYKKHFYENPISDINFSKVFDFLNPLHEVDIGFTGKILANISSKSNSVINSNFLTSHLLFNNYYLTALQNAFNKRYRKVVSPKEKKSIAKGSSWIDWKVYRRDSTVLKSLWEECSEHAKASSLVNELLGYDAYNLHHNTSEFHYQDFLNLLTIGLWLKYGCKVN